MIILNSTYFSIGDKVENFSQVGTVIDIRPDGALVVENKSIGRWLADPNKTLHFFSYFPAL